MLCVVLSLLTIAPSSGVVADIGVDAFVSGHDGYHTYRIPSLVRHPTTGDLLLFAEGEILMDSNSCHIIVRKFMFMFFFESFFYCESES